MLLFWGHIWPKKYIFNRSNPEKPLTTQIETTNPKQGGRHLTFPDLPYYIIQNIQFPGHHETNNDRREAVNTSYSWGSYVRLTWQSLSPALINAVKGLQEILSKSEREEDNNVIRQHQKRELSVSTMMKWGRGITGMAQNCPTWQGKEDLGNSIGIICSTTEEEGGFWDVWITRKHHDIFLICYLSKWGVIKRETKKWINNNEKPHTKRKV